MEGIADRPGSNGSDGLRLQALAWIRNEFEQSPAQRTAVTLQADRHASPIDLIENLRTNNDLVSQLQKTSARLACAREYLVHPDCNTVLGIVSLNRARMKQAGLLTKLGSNQPLADRLLAGPARTSPQRREKA